MGFEPTIVPASSIQRTESEGWIFHLKEMVGDTEGIVILPDMVYPYHPSTGMIVDPIVVKWLITTIEKHTTLSASDISLLCATSGEVTPQFVASLLGYDTFYQEFGLDSILGINRPFEESTAEAAATNGGLRPVEEIGDRPVISILSPRFRADGKTPIGHEGFLNELTLNRSDQLHKQIHFSVLDATYLNCGNSYRADRVFLSDDTDAIDDLIATFFGDKSTTAFENEEIKEITTNLEITPQSTSDVAESLMKFGYRTYARISGDVVPPQMKENR